MKHLDAGRRYVLQLNQHSQIRFITVVALNFILTQSVYFLCLLVSPYIIAYILSCVAGLVFTTVGHISHAFKSELTLRRNLAFGLYYFVHLFATMGLLIVLVEVAKVPKEFALILSSLLLLPIHFFLSRRLILSAK